MPTSIRWGDGVETPSVFTVFEKAAAHLKVRPQKPSALPFLLIPQRYDGSEPWENSLKKVSDAIWATNRIGLLPKTIHETLASWRNSHPGPRRWHLPGTAGTSKRRCDGPGAITVLLPPVALPRACHDLPCRWGKLLSSATWKLGCRKCWRAPEGAVKTRFSPMPL